MLSKTVSLITGGASGLGRATAQHLLKAGGRVVICDLPSQQKLGDELIASHGASKVIFSPCDVTKEEDVKRALDAVESAGWGKVNVAVNCAGVATPGKTVGKKGALPLASFAAVVGVNAVGTFNVVRLCAERMSTGPLNEQKQRGVIINTASIAGYEGQVGQAAYAASKGAIIAMTLPIARDLAPLGIRVMTIAPGLFMTPLMAQLPEQVRNEMGKQIPCPNRMGDPAEYGMLVESIITNPYLNGETIRLDGAYRMPSV